MERTRGPDDIEWLVDKAKSLLSEGMPLVDVMHWANQYWLYSGNVMVRPLCIGKPPSYARALSCAHRRVFVREIEAPILIGLQ